MDMDTERDEAETVTCIYCGTTVRADEADETEPYCSVQCAIAAGQDNAMDERTNHDD